MSGHTGCIRDTAECPSLVSFVENDGRVWANLNRLQQLPSKHALLTIAAFRAYLSQPLLARWSAVDQGLGCSASTSRVHAERSGGRVALAAIPSPSGAQKLALAAGASVAGFLDGFLDIDLNGDVEYIAKRATSRVRLLTTRDGSTLVGLKAKKARYEQLPEHEARTLFQEIDSDGNGLIDEEELVQACKRLGLPSNASYLSDVFEDGKDFRKRKICFQEYHEFINKKRMACSKAFNDLDIHHTGVLTETSLHNYLLKTGAKPRVGEARNMIEQLDRNLDGQITYAEFLRYSSLLPSNQLANNNAVHCWANSSGYLHGFVVREPGKWKLQEAIAGILAGIGSKTAVAPLDRVRTIMIAANSKLSALEAMKTAWEDGGCAGLFRGNTLSLAKAGAGQMVRYMTFDDLSDALNRHGMFGYADRTQPKGGPCVTMVAGLCSGLLEGLLTHPLDMVRTVMQTTGSSSLVKTSVVQAVRSICDPSLGPSRWRQVYSGLQPTLIGDSLSASVGFTMYHWAKAQATVLLGRDPRNLEPVLLGALSSSIMAWATVPFDVVQKRMMLGALGGEYAKYKYRNTFVAFKEIVQKEGWKVLFSSSIPSVMKTSLSIGISYGLHEWITRQTATGGIRKYRNEAKTAGNYEGDQSSLMGQSRCLTDSASSDSCLHSKP